MTKEQVYCSVIMSVYNGEEYLQEAIESVLNQTFSNFEFIIIDDASTDDSYEIINSYKDERIKIIRNTSNLFLATSLNKGIRESKGKYIIRMDADDICFLDRFEKQVTYMEEHPSVGISGSNAKIFGIESGQTSYKKYDDEIKLQMMFNCHLLHPSLIIRKSVITELGLYYDESFRKNQDYDLFVRAIPKTKFGNVTDNLLKYRHTQSNVKRKSHNQQQNIYDIKKRLFKGIGVDISYEEIDLYTDLSYQRYDLIQGSIQKVEKLMFKLIKSNKSTSFIDKKSFEKHHINLWESVCRNSTEMGTKLLRVYWNSKIEKNLLIKIKIFLLLAVKTVLRRYL